MVIARYHHFKQSLLLFINYIKITVLFKERTSRLQIAATKCDFPSELATVKSDILNLRKPKPHNIYRSPGLAFYLF